MKTSQIVSVLALLLSAPTVYATDVPLGHEGNEVRETIIHVTKTQLDVDLNEKTVICSSADYAEPMVKVLIPGLSGITLLDHQNQKATAPCVTTGESCMSGASPDDILQDRPGVEPVEVTVTAKKIEYINHKEKTCLLVLVEDVETNIRGKKLVHQRSNTLQPRSYERCAQGGV